MSNLELLPLPSLIDGRTLCETDGSLKEGNEDVVTFDGNVAYPSIEIDPKQIIKPTVIQHRLSSVFITPPQPLWKKAMSLIALTRIVSVFSLLANLQPTPLADCLSFPQKMESLSQFTLRHIAIFILWIYNWSINLYASLFPYSMLSSEETGQIFSPSLDWSNGVIKCFRWRPSGLRGALAVSNDDVFIYSSASIVLLLRHPFQKKIVDIVWNPKVEDEIAIVCQQVIIIWSIKQDSLNEKSRVPLSQATLIDKDIRCLCPITSATYDPSGNQIFVASPSSSKILILDHPLRPSPTQPAPGIKVPQSSASPLTFKPTVSSPSVMRTASTNVSVNASTQSPKAETEKEKVKFLRKWGQGVHRVLFAPNGYRLLTLPTSPCIRVYEKLAWSSKTWGGKVMSDICQCAVWSKPLGHYLLVAPRKDSSIYAVVMYDQPLPGEVGGEPTFMKVLDLSEYELPNGEMVGGAIHSMAWDAHSARLVVAFEENSQYLAVFKTTVRSILEIEPLGYIHGKPGEKPLAMDFHDSYKRGSLLTICWSSGLVSHIPFAYETQGALAKNRTLDLSRTRNNCSASSTPRNLTSYCRSPLLSSPLMPSPIGTPRNQQSDSFTDGPSNTSGTGYPSKHFLSSDSVISPRKPTLFSRLTASSRLSSQ